MTETSFQDFFEKARVGLYRTTPSGRFVAANNALARFLGYDSPEQLMRAVTDIGRQLYVDPSERTRVLRGAAETGVVEGAAVSIRRADGKRVWAEVWGRLVFDNHNEPLYFEGALYDVTRRRELEEELAQAREDLRQYNTGAPRNGRQPSNEVEGLRARVTRTESALHRIASELALIGMDRTFDVDRLNPSELEGFKTLTKRETEVLRAIVSGDRVRTIAKNFKLAPNTVRNHLKSIFIKLGVRSQAELVEKLKKR